jgi:hypothetical protein
MKSLGFLIGLVLGLIIMLCLVMVFPFIGDRGFSAAASSDFSPCSNWGPTLDPGDDPHRYDYNPSIETCRGNVTGPDYYRKAIEGCCKYKYGNVSP